MATASALARKRSASPSPEGPFTRSSKRARLAQATTKPTDSPLLLLPAEVRLQIWEAVFEDMSIPLPKPRRHNPMEALLVCKQFYEELPPVAVKHALFDLAWRFGPYRLETSPPRHIPLWPSFQQIHKLCIDHSQLSWTIWHCTSGFLAQLKYLSVQWEGSPLPAGGLLDLVNAAKYFVWPGPEEERLRFLLAIFLDSHRRGFLANRETARQQTEEECRWLWGDIDIGSGPEMVSLELETPRRIEMETEKKWKATKMRGGNMETETEMESESKTTEYDKFVFPRRRLQGDKGGADEMEVVVSSPTLMKGAGFPERKVVRLPSHASLLRWAQAFNVYQPSLGYDSIVMVREWREYWERKENGE